MWALLWVLGPPGHEEGETTDRLPSQDSINADFDVPQGTENSIITSYNRNFTGRLDGNPATHIFLASPEMVMAKIFSDDLAFDPTQGSIPAPDGSTFRFSAPTGDALPATQYADADHVYTAPPSSDRSSVHVQISPTSERLQLLAPFAP